MAMLFNTQNRGLNLLKTYRDRTAQGAGLDSPFQASGYVNPSVGLEAAQKESGIPRRLLALNAGIYNDVQRNIQDRENKQLELAKFQDESARGWAGIDNTDAYHQGTLDERNRGLDLRGQSNDNTNAYHQGMLGQGQQRIEQTGNIATMREAGTNTRDLNALNQKALDRKSRESEGDKNRRARIKSAGMLAGWAKADVEALAQEQMDKEDAAKPTTGIQSQTGASQPKPGLDMQTGASPTQPKPILLPNANGATTGTAQVVTPAANAGTGAKPGLPPLSRPEPIGLSALGMNGTPIQSQLPNAFAPASNPIDAPIWDKLPPAYDNGPASTSTVQGLSNLAPANPRFDGLGRQLPMQPWEIATPGQAALPSGSPQQTFAQNHPDLGTFHESAPAATPTAAPALPTGMTPQQVADAQARAADRDVAMRTPGQTTVDASGQTVPLPQAAASPAPFNPIVMPKGLNLAGAAPAVQVAAAAPTQTNTERERTKAAMIAKGWTPEQAELRILQFEAQGR